MSQRLIDLYNAGLHRDDTARAWRDRELLNTDWIIPIVDHSERNAYIVYRQRLRDWPSQDEFPEGQPTL